MANLADRIKSLRLSANMTQTEFGEKFGIVKSTVSLYESGKSTPNDEIKKQICDYFDISLDYLIGREDLEGHDSRNNDSSHLESDNGYYINEETAKAAQEIFENKELRMLFDATRDADPEDLKALHNMALALKRKERGNSDDTGC
ncbi:XRE family transcriptional regulator [bacterium 1XD8-76]|nr:XRE family transcriptional regulator [bacterium 1XD8-76]